jgi:hypothetical protein
VVKLILWPQCTSLPARDEVRLERADLLLFGRHCLAGKDDNTLDPERAAFRATACVQ